MAHAYDGAGIDSQYLAADLSGECRAMQGTNQEGKNRLTAWVI